MRLNSPERLLAAAGEPAGRAEDTKEVMTGIPAACVATQP